MTDTGRLVCTMGGEVVADVPAASLGDGPSYDRPYRAPSTPASGRRFEPPSLTAPKDVLLHLLGSANLSSKRWLWEQYDHQVMLGTVVGPGPGAAVLRLPGSDSRIAVTVDCNGRFCQLDPRLGAQHAVAEAYRNLCTVGAEPVAVTNCLNFGNPEVPEVMWQFVEAVKGMGHACKALDTPIVGGNVSFYNQTGDDPIYPTPVIGMVGILPAGTEPPAPRRMREGLAVVLLGETRDELGGSEYQRTIEGRLEGRVPELDLVRESAIGWVIREMIARGQVFGAQDCSEGGIGIALAELCIFGHVGMEIAPEAGMDPIHWLFSESASRIVLAIGKDDVTELTSLAQNLGPRSRTWAR